MAYEKGQATDYLDLLDKLDLFVTSNNVATAVVAAGGSSYVEGDVLTASGGTSTTAATFEVTGVTGGSVDTVRVILSGAYTSNPGNPVSTTGGTGTGCTLTLTWNTPFWAQQRRTQEGVSATVSAGGTNYAVNDKLYVSGGVGVDAVTQLNVDTVSGTAVATVSVDTGFEGSYAEVPSNPVDTTSDGSGTGCTLTMTWQDSTGETEIIWEGEGDGSDTIYVGVRTFNDSGGTGAYNWELAGMTGYSAAVPWETQAGISPGRWDGIGTDQQGAYVPLRNSTIDYWFFVTGRRICAVFKMGTTYTNMYVGWINPFATSTEYVYPLAIFGCTGEWDKLFSDTTLDLGGLTDPIQGNVHSQGPAFIRDPGGNWKTVANSERSGAGRNALRDLVIYPCGSPDFSAQPAQDKGTTDAWNFNDTVPNTGVPGTAVQDIIYTENSSDDLTILYPTMIIEVDPNQIVYGELDGVYWISSRQSGTTIVAEDTLDISTDEYICFQNGNRTDVFAFFCLLRNS